MKKYLWISVLIIFLSLEPFNQCFMILNMQICTVTFKFWSRYLLGIFQMRRLEFIWIFNYACILHPFFFLLLIWISYDIIFCIICRLNFYQAVWYKQGQSYESHYINPPHTFHPLLKMTGTTARAFWKLPT